MVLGSIPEVAREYDAQLLESVAVRRGRLRESLLWGQAHRRLGMVDNLKRFAVGVVVAAVGCAGCVGWAFLENVLTQQQVRQQSTVGQVLR